MRLDRIIGDKLESIMMGVYFAAGVITIVAIGLVLLFYFG